MKPGRAPIVNVALTCLAVCLAACHVEILHDLDESEANSVVAALQQEQIAADKLRLVSANKATYTVSVPRREAPRAWQILQRQHLPRPKDSGLGEVFGNVGLVPTATQERALMRHALAGEIARTLQSVEGVHQARVHVVLPEPDPLAPSDAAKARPRAAVLLTVSARAFPLAKEDIQQLVAGSIEDLDPHAVAVVISPTDGPAGRAGGAQAASISPSSSSAVEPLANLGPYRVAATSRPSLAVALVAGVLLLATLGFAVLWLVRRNRALAQAVASAQNSVPLTDSRADLSPELSASLGLIGHSFERSRSAIHTRPPRAQGPVTK